MAGADYIVVIVEGVEQIELEADSEGRFTLSSLDSLGSIIYRMVQECWFAVHVAEFAVSWCARGERRIDEAIRRLAVGRESV